MDLSDDERSEVDLDRSFPRNFQDDDDDDEEGMALGSEVDDDIGEVGEDEEDVSDLSQFRQELEREPRPVMID